MRGNMINLEQENKAWRANHQKLSKFNNNIFNTRTTQQEKINTLENQVKQFMSLCCAGNRFQILHQHSRGILVKMLSIKYQNRLNEAKGANFYNMIL